MKTLWLLILALLIAPAVMAQTGPGSVAVPAPLTLQNAVTADGNGTAVKVQPYGSAQFTVTVSGSATVTFKSRNSSTASYQTAGCYKMSDWSAASTTAATGKFFCPLPGDYDAYPEIPLR